MHQSTDWTAFTNRLRKMARHFDKWARRQQLSCYRVYRADLEAVPLLIDRYGSHVYVSAYAKKAQGVFPLDWQQKADLIISEVLEVPIDQIVWTLRQRQQGNQQYEKQDSGVIFTAEENDLRFEVNLGQYLDTGLFLDHRPLRKKVREAAAEKTVLNLFCYTGSFTVYAAAGGATRTTSVDLSNTYLAWTKRNLELNELDGPQHEFVKADAKTWLRASTEPEYDIIVLDPPTFSNSKSMGFILDLKEDHSYLINDCLRRLIPGGTLYFSTNARSFKLREDAIWQGAEWKEITGQTVPPDFQKGPAHRCWAIRHK